MISRDPGPDWVVAAERSVSRKLFRGFGTTLFIGSYVALLGALLVMMFKDSEGRDVELSFHWQSYGSRDVDVDALLANYPARLNEEIETVNGTSVIVVIK